MTSQDPNPDDGTPRYNGRTPRELASDAENSLRGIVHLAEADETPLNAREVYGVLSGMTRMLEHVPEVATRLRAVVTNEHTAGTLVISAGRFAHAPDQAHEALTAAVDDLLNAYGALYMAMDKAQACLSDASFSRTEPGSS